MFNLDPSIGVLAVLVVSLLAGIGWTIGCALGGWLVRRVG